MSIANRRRNFCVGRQGCLQINWRRATGNAQLAHPDLALVASATIGLRDRFPVRSTHLPKTSTSSWITPASPLRSPELRLATSPTPCVPPLAVNAAGGSSAMHRSRQYQSGRRAHEACISWSVLSRDRAGVDQRHGIVWLVREGASVRAFASGCRVRAGRNGELAAVPSGLRRFLLRLERQDRPGTGLPERNFAHREKTV